MDRDEIIRVLNFQQEVIEKVLETEYTDYAQMYGQENKPVEVPADAIVELMARDARFLGNGAFSVAYLTNDNKVLVLSVEWDRGKDMLYELSPLAHIPEMYHICAEGDFVLYEMPFVDVKDYDEMSDEEQEIYDVINSYYDLASLVDDLDDPDTEAYELPESLKETLKAINDYNDCFNLDTKPENVGWDENGIVLFDLFLE